MSASDTDPVVADKALVVGTRRAMTLLNRGKNGVFNLIKDGSIESYLDGNRRQISVSSIQRYVAERLAAERKAG